MDWIIVGLFCLYQIFRVRKVKRALLYFIQKDQLNYLLPYPPHAQAVLLDSIARQFHRPAWKNWLLLRWPTERQILVEIYVLQLQLKQQRSK